ncbi:hypothetical protein ACFLXQ_04415 [Chloroflexota bacterium]
MVIETDLKYIEAMAAERADENWKFRIFLKQLDMDTQELDAIVHQITDEVSSQIDCTKCANCCKQVRPVLDKDDISGSATIRVNPTARATLLIGSCVACEVCLCSDRFRYWCSLCFAVVSSRSFSIEDFVGWRYFILRGIRALIRSLEAQWMDFSQDLADNLPSTGVSAQL